MTAIHIVVLRSLKQTFQPASACRLYFSSQRLHNEELLRVSVNHYPQKQDVGYRQPYRTFIMRRALQEPSIGLNMPGQGLKKLDERAERELEEKSMVLRFLNRRIEDQNRGRERFPILPDYKFMILSSLAFTFFILIIWIFYPDLEEIVVGMQEEPTKEVLVAPDRTKSPLVVLYKFLPLRIFSRAFGRFNEIEFPPFTRPVLYGIYCKLFGVNMDDALVKNLKSYKTLNQFFTRPADPAARPIDVNADVVFPSDGKILTQGTAEGGFVEQVKDVTYSLKKFLGPLIDEPSHDNWGKTPSFKYTFQSMSFPTKNYQAALMQDPVNNQLYQCVIYLAPGNLHGFNSPVDWTVKHRRHFPGDLLSVNPKIARFVKELFVTNERVVLSGTWKHGFFSMAAVGATDVGNIKIYEDVLLQTNRTYWKAGTFFDRKFGENGFCVSKGDRVGEFKLGSTIVLVFEAPKGMKFHTQPGDKVKIGEKLF